MLKNPFAINENDNIVYINDLNTNDKNKKYYCVECGKELIPKMGKINIWHFAHKSKSSCFGGLETALHRYAKDLIKRSNFVFLPDLSFREYYSLNYEKIKFKDEIDKYLRKNDNNKYEFNNCILKKNKYHYVWIENEKKINDFIPDCLVEIKGKKLAVEIHVTHEVDEIKQDKSKKANIDMIEIDISNFYSEFNKNKIFDIDAYILKYADRTWIYKTNIAEFENKIKEKIYNDGDCLINEKYTKLETFKRLEKKENEKRLLENREKQEQLLRKKKEEKRQFVENHRAEYDLKNLEKIEKILRYQSEYNNNDNYNVYDIFVCGEYAFKGERKIWQKKIFDTFINGRKGKIIELAKVNSWVEKYSGLQYYKEFNFLDGFYNKFDAIKFYLQILLNIGCLENISNYKDEVTFYMQLEVMEDNIDSLNEKILSYYKVKEEYVCEYCGNIITRNNLIDSFYIKNFGMDQICFEIVLKQKIKLIKNKI